MNPLRPLLALAGALALSGCAEMMTATPQLEMKSGSSQKMEVKAKVMAVGSLDYSPDGKRLASAGVAPVVKIWDMTTAKGLRTLSIPAPYGVGDVVYSPDGKLLAAFGATGLFGDTVTYLWDAETGAQVKTIPGNLNFRLAFSAGSKYLLGSEFKAGGLFDVPTWETKQFDLGNDTVLRSFHGYSFGAMSPDGRNALLKGDSRSGLMLVDLQTGREIWHTGGGRVDAVAFTPDRRHVLASRSEFHGTLGTRATMSLALLDAATGNQIREFARYNVENTFLATDKDFAKLSVLEVAPDGRRFISGTNRGEYKLWDVATGQMIRQLKRPDEKLMFDMSPAHAAFSPNGKLVAVTSAASVRIYNVADGEEAATMIAFDDGEWLVTTPSGYYNASEKGDQYLSVSVAGSPFTISQLRESFYRPDLVKVALSGGTLSDYKKIADIKPPPTVAIVDTPATTASPKISVSLRIKDQGGGIGDVRLYRNGAAVVFEKTRNLNVVDTTQESQTLRYDISLEPGNNTIRAIAFNADNSMQSTDTSINVQASIAARQPALHAIVIGIKDFANPRLALKYSVADAELFASTLETRGKGLFSSVHVKRLFKPAQTTNTAIVAALKQARQEVGPEDLFVFYVASHGTVDDGQYLLITSNVGSTTTAKLKQDALTQDSLKEMISNIPASKKLVVLDTCSAGQLGDAIQVAMLTRGMSDDTAMKVLSRAVGSTVLSAATSVQEALEGYKGHGLFTYVIVEGLNGAADADKDGFVKTLELADYVDNQVPELAEKVFQHKQYPIVSPTGQGFPLVRTR
jgi:WD40 repeat protein